LETITQSKYTNKLIGNTAFMLLNKPIGASTNKNETISGPDFAKEVYAEKGLGREIKVKINCFGGDVFQGWDMVDSIIETKAKTEVAGVAYSMAGICLIVGSYRTAYPHSKAMIHSPRRADGKKDESEFMKGIQAQFKSILKGYTKFTEDEITEMIDSGKDYYFTAQQMKDKGMIDEILPSKYNVYAGLSDKGMYEYCNTLIEQEQNSNIEMEILAKLFGGKTESENLVSAVQMKAENETLKASKAQSDSEIVALKAKIQELEAEKGKVSARKKAEELIESAVKADKLNGVKAEDKAKWIENATENYDVVKSMIDNMKAQKGVSAASFVSDEKTKDKSYAWLAQNEPETLKAMAESDPELFEKLATEHAKSQNEKK